MNQWNEMLSLPFVCVCIFFAYLTTPFCYFWSLVICCLGGCRLDVQKLKSLGVPPGPLYGRIKAGETVTLPSGVQVSVCPMYGWINAGEKVTLCRGECLSYVSLYQCWRDGNTVHRWVSCVWLHHGWRDTHTVYSLQVSVQCMVGSMLEKW